MLIFKAPNNDTFRLDSADQADRLPPGSVKITEAELADIVAARIEASQPEAVSALQRIESLEREHLLPRATREFMLTFMEATAIQQGAGQGLAPEEAIAALRAGNSGYRKVKELDEEIQSLRGEI